MKFVHAKRSQSTKRDLCWKHIPLLRTTTEHNLSYRNIEIITIDELSLMTEEDISDRVSKCRSEMGKRAGDVYWRYAWEVELAYALRELQIRQERRIAHQTYLEQESERDRQAFLDEERLPEYEGNRIPKFVKESFGWN